MKSLSPYRRQQLEPFFGFEDLLNNFLTNPDSNSSKTFLPVEFHETENAYHLSADIPGLKKEDISIEFHDHVLSISAERSSSEEKKDKQGYWSEKKYGRYTRSFRLPGEITEDAVEAKYESGVLEITLPKKEVTKAKAIKIQ